MELKIGDFVYIKESVIDTKVQNLLIAKQNRSAIRWDGYRNFKFEILGVDEENLIILRDADGNEIHISKRALEAE